MKYSTTVIKQQFVCTLFNIVIIFSRGHEYYTGLKQVKGESVFTELNNELLGTWNKWGSVTGGTCTVYSNEGGEWVWHTNTCDLPCLYICEYIVPTPGNDKFSILHSSSNASICGMVALHKPHSITFDDTLYGFRHIWLNFTYFLSQCLPFLV